MGIGVHVVHDHHGRPYVFALGQAAIDRDSHRLVGVVHHGVIDAKRRVHHRLGNVVADHPGTIDLRITILLGTQREHPKIKISFALTQAKHLRRDRQHHHPVVERHSVVAVRREDIEEAGIGDAKLVARHADEDGKKHIIHVGRLGEVVLEQATVAATGQLVIDPAVEVGVDLQMRVVDERVRVGPVAGVGDGEIKRRFLDRTNLRIVRRHTHREDVSSNVGGIFQPTLGRTDRSQLKNGHQRLGMCRVSPQRKHQFDGVLFRQANLADSRPFLRGRPDNGVIGHTQCPIVAIEPDFSADLVDPATGASVDFFRRERVTTPVELFWVRLKRHRHQPVVIRRNLNRSLFRQFDGEARFGHRFLNGQLERHSGFTVVGHPDLSRALPRCRERQVTQRQGC